MSYVQMSVYVYVLTDMPHECECAQNVMSL